MLQDGAHGLRKPLAAVNGPLGHTKTIIKINPALGDRYHALRAAHDTLGHLQNRLQAIAFALSIDRQALISSPPTALKIPFTQWPTFSVSQTTIREFAEYNKNLFTL